jgi:hypothetical protein
MKAEQKRIRPTAAIRKLSGTPPMPILVRSRKRRDELFVAEGDHWVGFGGAEGGEDGGGQGGQQ